ncbi:MAG: VanZ family protein [archaeon]
MISFFEKEVKLSWFVTIVIAATIFWVSSLTLGGGTSGTSFLSVFYHFFAFFFLSAFLLVASVKGNEEYGIFFLVIIVSVLYGISDELHQFFVPGRASSGGDVLVNTAGILSASLIYFVRLRMKKSFNR